MSKQSIKGTAHRNSVSSTSEERRKDKLSATEFFCPYKSCQHYSKLGLRNITFHSRCGHRNTRVFLCQTCGKHFSELKNTLFWNTRLNWNKIIRVYEALLKGVGIRATARSVGISKNTVKRYLCILRDRGNYELASIRLSQHGSTVLTAEALESLVGIFPAKLTMGSANRQKITRNHHGYKPIVEL